MLKDTCLFRFKAKLVAAVNTITTIQTLTVHQVRTVQLKCNLMPARGLPGKKVRVNLQTGACKGAGARNVLYQPGANLWRPF